MLTETWWCSKHDSSAGCTNQKPEDCTMSVLMDEGGFDPDQCDIFWARVIYNPIKTIETDLV